MILHKGNTVEAELLYKTIDDLSIVNNNKGNVHLNASELQMLEKYSHFIQNLIAFEKEIKRDENIKPLIMHFLNYVKRIIPLKDAVLMFYDDVDNKLVPVEKLPDAKIVKVMNNFNKEGIFKNVLKSKNNLVVPDLESYNSNGPKLNYLIQFFNTEKSNYGLLAVLTSLPKDKITDLDKKNIYILLNILLGKLEKIKLTEKLNDAYDELQTYQAKLSNDFRLSAIGEMTEGIIEDIATPLQVIVSNVDILIDEIKQNFELKQIKVQTKKINRVVGRLAKFADVNRKNITIKPCNINDIVKDYFGLVKSTLENANMEYILDFDKDLPPILSHPNFLYQMLTNIFSMLKSFKAAKGGIIIQTRFKEDNVYLRVISTIKIDGTLIDGKENEQYSLALKIIKNLMKKHEGAVELDLFENAGTAISLRFPLKRKIRK